MRVSIYQEHLDTRFNNFDILFNYQTRPSHGQNQNQSLAYGTTPSSKFGLKISFTLKVLSSNLLISRSTRECPILYCSHPSKNGYTSKVSAQILSACELVTELIFFWFSRGNLIQNMSATATKPYMKEIRNLNDKAVVLDLMRNFANFLINMGYPEQVTPKELQKIDKQNFVKYFNVIICCISSFLVFNLYYLFLFSTSFSILIRISSCNPALMRMI